MYNNQNTFGANPYMMSGPQYTAAPQPRMTQPLTVEEIKALRNNAPAFTLEVSAEDMMRAKCTHKTLDGKFAVVNNNDAEGSVTCSICGARFILSDAPAENVQTATDLIIDILQTIKTNYVDIPEAIAVQFFQMLPFIEKIPKLYQIAADNFNKYEGAGIVNQSQNMFGFNMLGAITSPSFGFQQQPYMPQQPYMAQQPMWGNPQQAPMSGNPFGNYGVPYGGVPQTPVQTEMPTDNSGQNPVQQKVFNV